MQGAQISDNCSIGFCSSLEAEAEKFYLPRTRLNRYQSSVEQYEPRSEGVVLLVRAHLSRHLMTEVVSDCLVRTNSLVYIQQLHIQDGIVWQSCLDDIFSSNTPTWLAKWGKA